MTLCSRQPLHACCYATANKATAALNAQMHADKKALLEAALQISHAGSSGGGQVKALYDWPGSAPTDLAFNAGDIIDVISRDPNGCVPVVCCGCISLL